MSDRLVCAGCSLLCDDVTVADGRFSPECPLGAQWYRSGAAADDGGDATVAGRPTDVETALARSVELLADARRPLVRGFAGATIEDARAAVTLADRIGAIVAADRQDGPWPGAPAFPLRGASTATLGEIRDRSQLVVVWREDPETTHPRLLERLGLGSAGSRTLAVVDDRTTPTGQLAQLRLDWPRERDGEALSALHLLARGREPSDIDAGLRQSLEPLARRLEVVSHATFVYGATLAAASGGQRRALALHELVRALSHGRHVVTLPLGGAPGIRGADDVLTWQTGYAGTVDLGPGHPELMIGTTPVVEHERVDLIVRVEEDRAASGDGGVTAAAGETAPAGETALSDETAPSGETALSDETAPTDETAAPNQTTAAGRAAVVALSSRPGRPAPAVWIRTAAAGVGAGGTMHRLDGVPLALRPPRPSAAPSAAELLQRLLRAVGG